MENPEQLLRLQQKNLNDLQGGIFANLRGVIKLIDELRDCGIEGDVKLPKIVVVGTQSSGKSSVLEQIVGFDFLPRGSGVVTRVPLEIRLVHVTDKFQEEFKPYAYFGTEKDKLYYDFAKDVKKRIEELTDQLAGQNKNIVDKQITLTIFSSQCPNLTLIDIPGITKVPMENSDQPENIEQITKELTKKYISDQLSIILCVIPINQDLSVSDALQISREHDKEGHRTFGVLTKIDIMDKGTNCLNVLENKTIKLKHGYIAVKCRSQQDIETKKTIQDALFLEEQYFMNHKIYSSVPELTGTNNLSKKLSKLLEFNIREHLPMIQADIYKKIEEKEHLIERLGDVIPQDDNGKRQLLFKKTIEIASMFRDLMSNTIRPGVRISQNQLKQPFGSTYLLQLYTQFPQKIKPIQEEILIDYTLREVACDLIRFSKPIPGFLPYEAFQQKVRGILPFFKPPIQQLLEETQRHLQELLMVCVEEFTSGSQQLKEYFEHLMNTIFEDIYCKTKELTEEIQEAEKTFAFSSNDNFFALESKLKTQKITFPSEIDATIYQVMITRSEFIDQSVFSLVKTGQDILEEQITNQARSSNGNYECINSYNKNKEYKFFRSTPKPSKKEPTNSNLPTSNLHSMLKNDKININGVEIDIKTRFQELKDDVFIFSVRFYRYLNNLHISLSEQIPKIIETFLVQKLSSSLQIIVFDNLSKIEDVNDILIEDQFVSEKRKKAYESLQCLYKARQTIFNILGPINFQQLSKNEESEKAM